MRYYRGSASNSAWQRLSAQQILVVTVIMMTQSRRKLEETESYWKGRHDDITTNSGYAG